MEADDESHRARLMHPHFELLERFYSAFQRRDAAAMAECYHAEVEYSDPVFPALRGREAGAMWAMLCARAQDLVIDFNVIAADDTRGRARWDARYTFTGTGRKVHNRITAEFVFREGRIIRHVDRFDFWVWARQALGPVGWVLGWSPFVRQRVRRQAAAALQRR